jgi:lysylphosphatidylglycerol synthetase-like protein (DUF2156 family)
MKISLLSSVIIIQDSERMESNSSLTREQNIALIHKWGSSVIESLLDPSCSYFSIPEVEGLIGFYSNRRCAVVFGDPVCPPESREKLVSAFHQQCESAKKNVVYLVASEEFALWWQKKMRGGMISFGEELYIDPRRDPRTCSGKRGIVLRGKIRRAEKLGVSVKEYCEKDPDLEQKIQSAASQWIQHRKGPQIYISRVRFFSDSYGKRWFYAQNGDQVVGVLAILQLKAKEGWVLDRIMTVPDAPQGTPELLVMSLIEQLAKEQCGFLTFGAINASFLGTMTGFGKLASFFLPRIYKTALQYFKIEGKRKFWEKFFPESSPSYLLFKNPTFSYHEILGLMRALNVSYQKSQGAVNKVKS